MSYCSVINWVADTYSDDDLLFFKDYPIYKACEDGDIEKVLKIIKDDEIILDNCLYIACFNNYKDLALLLIEK